MFTFVQKENFASSCPPPTCLCAQTHRYVQVLFLEAADGTADELTCV